MIEKKKAGRHKGKMTEYIGITLPKDVIKIIDAIKEKWKINSRSACINYLLQAVIIPKSGEDRKELRKRFIEVMTIGEALPIIQTLSRGISNRPHKKLITRFALANKLNQKYFDREQKKLIRVWHLKEEVIKKIGKRYKKRIKET